MRILIIANSQKDWPFRIPDVDVVDAWSYLTRPEFSESRGVKVFNLCRSYKYQTVGYYVSLLAEARGHKPLPSITTLQDLRSQAMMRLVSEELEDLIQQSMGPIQSERFTLSIYFGRNLAKRYERLSLHLFNLFQSPLLRVQFKRYKKWQIRSVATIAANDVPEGHWPFVVDVARQYFEGRRGAQRKRTRMRYDLAILHDPAEAEPPSEPEALKRFIRAAENLGVRAELITRDDYARIAEFDALFIRETTSVNHHTYRFARRASNEGLIVIDDPQSIVRCTNKVYLAELLNRHDISTPKTVVLHRDNASETAAELGFPCVLKRPDSSFSRGVIKVASESELKTQLDQFFEDSDLVVAQEYLPTTFDWRIGILNRKPLYACKYFMAADHWQIVRQDLNGDGRYGKAETIPVELAPRRVVNAALKAANLIGDGLYGVDVKESNKKYYVIEVNDNPNVDVGVEDAVLRDELYNRIMEVFLDRIERSKAGIAVSMSADSPFHLFEVFGVELEYMIVDAQTLDVRPITDRVFEAVNGEITSDVEMGDISWSNELTAHVIELKTSEPARSLASLPAAFQDNVRRINAVLESMNARLMPSAMHPWMDPDREMVLWAHDYSEVYQAFNRIFDCRGHGWANLQAVHLNLPFTGDAEFGRLHAAIRVLLPILPALAASSPLMDGRLSGVLDSRVDVYRHNCRRIPAATGRVVPEPVFSEGDYRSVILEPLYQQIAPLDTDGIMQEEWLNSRGAIARFERGTIEIRVLDVQDCPQADVAICALIVDVLQALIEGHWGDPARLETWPTEALHDLLQATIRDADRAVIADADYARLFGMEHQWTITAGDLWRHLHQAVGPRGRSHDSSVKSALQILLERGPLARRILIAVGSEPSREQIAAVYRQLCECLASGRMFLGID